ncbi:uncharacterized protein TNIN_156181 [Trichonephila inaurata madagascariensis]|uniref:Uncharacterized protein n=1 Tax=Trichonephila inaurata madagascariensis TaxID=2747483 RepID=A0A8X6I6L0_9ARAC|nr:uncharacterized protein TNIN_156181 [Trichonephila inaurata madagascariensis]
MLEGLNCRRCSISFIAFSLHVLPVSFEQSSSNILNPSNDLTRLNATYACPLGNSTGPRYTTTLSTLYPRILWTVQTQHSINGSCVQALLFHNFEVLKTVFIL